MKSANNIATILNLNTEIDNSIIKGTSFVDKELETLYQKSNFTTSNIKNIVSNLIIFLGYIASFPYIFFAFYRLSYVILFVTGAVISSISLLIAMIKNDQKTIYINNRVQIFITSHTLLIKGFMLLGYYGDPINDNIEEMLRIVIYHFVSTGIYLITNIESDFFTYLFYFLENISLIIASHIMSTKNRFYHLEGLTSFCLFTIFYSIRRQWDYKLRVIFGEQQKFEKLFSYTIEYLDGLNGFNINFQNKNTVIFGEKIRDYFESLRENGFISAEESGKNKEKKIDDNENLDSYKDLIKINKINDDYLTSNFMKKLLMYKFDKIY
jgi:hypothetical protein